VSGSRGSDAHLLIKHRSVRKNGPSDYTLLVASGNSAQAAALHEFEVKAGGKAKLSVEYGDFSAPLTKAAEALAKASCSDYH